MGRPRRPRALRRLLLVWRVNGGLHALVGAGRRGYAVDIARAGVPERVGHGLELANAYDKAWLGRGSLIRWERGKGGRGKLRRLSW